MSQTQTDALNVSAVKRTGKFPSAIPYIVGNEAAERFNYYGLRAILTTFLVAAFFKAKFPLTPEGATAAEAGANAATHDFVAMSYLLPLFGGMISDWFWGKYKTILRLSLVYVLGNIILAFSTANENLFMTGLLFVAIGAGGIKPCVSANVGDQFDQSNQHLMSKAFDAFYFSINLGSFFSILLIPYLNAKYGPQIAFGVPAIAMLVATAFFYAGNKKYVKVPPKGDNNKLVILITAFVALAASYLYFDRTVHLGMGPVMLSFAFLTVVFAFIFQKQWFAKPGNFVGINLFALTRGGFAAATEEYGADKIEGVRSVWRVLAVFAFIPFFWALWDQNQSEWVIQAQHCDLNFMGRTWQAEQISAANAVLILLFIPLFSFGIYPGIQKLGINVTSLRKFGAGFFITALSFVIISLIQTQIDGGAKPSIGWQLLAYVILTAGEILISITGLEYAYTQSPPSMKSTISALYLLMVTLGNVLVSVIQNNIKNGGFFAQFHGASFFWLFTGICFTTGIIFALVSPFIKQRSYIGATID